MEQWHQDLVARLESVDVGRLEALLPQETTATASTVRSVSSAQLFAPAVTGRHERLGEVSERLGWLGRVVAVGGQQGEEQLQQLRTG